ncbi:DcaP family trimeric outer membrane transporter [Alteromonas lipolytica]|uniref:Porin n=1 Tax=Alteromonas lipolytica TaxID=1856405 RepID=A0A1E8FK19_9ALTE|nr:DcaP family trimeric outer membrane transporter [Alteromonas lipolytica]OFI36280.1 porin [Alteromonas lipolytica]GGF79377.1 hypothetical protein GCM10011338_34660 [Alteromonas lipolytica]
MKTTMKTITRAVSLAVAGFAMASANAATIGSTDVKFTGYVKADGIYSDYSNGEGHPLNRDFYVPSTIAVGAADDDIGGRFDGHVRQSRFRFTTNTPVSDSDSITGVLEFDFMVTKGDYDNERISNSYLPRLRHAFLKYKNWLVGQTWTTFMDVGALPESLDFIGTTDGVTFARQTMVRYSQNGFDFALENPETTVVGVGATDDNSVPDVIAAYTMKSDWGHFKVAGLFRQLSYEVDGIDASDTGMGISLTSKIKIGDTDDIRLSFYTGSGIGRYAALNAAQGAVYNPENGSLDAVDSTGYAIAYRHMWTDKARSSVMFSAFDADAEQITSVTMGDYTDKTYSARVNYIYSVSKTMTVGAEYAYAKRETEAGLEGDMSRLQFSAKYAF